MTRLLAKALPVLLLVYAGASFVHFAHNAEYLADYPNLPAWLTRLQVYAVWLGITAVGLLGYGLLLVWRWPGLVILALYAALVLAAVLGLMVRQRLEGEFPPRL